MKKVIKIDAGGFFIRDVLIRDDDEVPIYCIETLCPDGFYSPKWDGIQWVEGMSQSEIDLLRNTPQPPTSAEQIQSLKDQQIRIDTDMAAFMDFVLSTLG